MKIRLILLALLLSVLYFRCFFWLTTVWLNDPYYSHGFLVLFISAFTGWRNYVKYKSEFTETEPYKPGIIIFAFGLILYIIGFITLFPFLAAFSFLFIASGLILHFYGIAVMRHFIFPVVFLIFAIPLPPEVMGRVAFALQSLSAYYPALIIEMLGIPVTRIGAEINLENSSFIVGLPCSGMNSIIALLALTTVFIYILKCPCYKKAILLSVTIPIAIFANILRITALLLIANAYGADTANGFFHTFFSPLLFVVAFIFLILSSIIIGCKVGGSDEKFL